MKEVNNKHMENQNFAEYTKELSEKMEKILDKKRYTHTISVAHTAACLAMRYQVDPYKAYIAGLLHDNAKCFNDNKKIELCKKYNLSVSEAEYKNPELLHAKLGSYFAEHKYNIQDEDILSAITYHTTGKPEMNKLEKIIYIADYIEIHRKKLSGMDKARELAFQDLDKCILMILQDIIEYLNSKNASIDNITIDTYAYYKNIKE